MLLCPSSAEGCCFSPSTRVGEKFCPCTSPWGSMCSSGERNQWIKPLFYSSSENSALCGCSCLFLGEKTLQQVDSGQATVGHHPHISHMPVLVSPHLEVPFLWRQGDTDVLDTTKWALRLHLSNFFPFSSLEMSLNKANCTNLICSRTLGQTKNRVDYSVQDIQHGRKRSSSDLKASSALDTGDNCSQRQIKN